MAQLTITIPDAQVVRVREALAAKEGADPATFTAEDARQSIINSLKIDVLNYEATQGLQGIQDDYETAKANYVPPDQVDVS